ncbi:MAG: biotin transporter BioY [Oscillospiraceae bacterium]|nr:biotin transporter BioY [Oscillospiraceae bacterium]
MKRKQISVKDMTYTALGAAVIAVCSWITIPSAVPFTMQTFGIFAVSGISGGKRGLCSVLVYILLGAVGLPVFSGFKGGIGVLFGVTGGYITGFIGLAAVYYLITGNGGSSTIRQYIGMLSGLAVCYIFGTVWFLISGGGDILSALAACVFPFVVPDILKLMLSMAVVKRTGRVIHSC